MPVKLLTMAILSFGASDIKSINRLLNINEDSLRTYIQAWEREGLIEKTEDCRPASYQLTKTGRTTLIKWGRRRC